MVEAAGVGFLGGIEPTQVTGKQETPETPDRIKIPIRRTYCTRGAEQNLLAQEGPIRAFGEDTTGARGLPHHVAKNAATIGCNESEMPTFPGWWNWELTFTSHAELRMEQRGVTEVEVRAMLEGATGFEPSVVEGRFMIHTHRAQRPWIVILEPDADATLLVVVTVYEVPE